MSSVDTVLLVHGLWLNALAMRLMRRRIERSGYAVHAYSYPTMRLTLNENAERLRCYCENLGGGKLHFVGHSMGGLVALKAAQAVSAECRGRIVLVGTPFVDSFSARRLQRLPGGHSMLGRCIAQWLSDGPSQGLAAFEIGVIAGSGGVGLGRVIAPRLPQPNDGVVALEETRVPGMRDHIVLPVSHSQMLVSRDVVLQVCTFLKEGKFGRAHPAAA